MQLSAPSLPARASGRSVPGGGGRRRRVAGRVPVLPGCLALGLLAAAPASAASWYVDGALARSGDGTSWQKAWRSFASVKWAQLRPGDTLYVSGGKAGRTYTASLVVGASGADGQPITIAPGLDPGHAGKVVLDGRMSVPSGVVVENAEHVVVRGFDLRNFTEDGIRIRDARDVLAEANAIHAPARGFHILRTSEVTIRGNVVTTPTFVTLQTDGIYSQDSRKNRYERNTIIVSNGETEGHDDGIQSFRDTDLEIVGNYIEQRNPKTYNAQGIFLEDARGTMLVANNVVYGPSTRNSLILLLNRTRTDGVLLAYNNTLVGSEWGVVQIQDAPDSRIFNNILYSTAANGHALTIVGRPPPPANIDHNLYFTPNGTPVYAAKERENYTWQDWRARGYEANGVEGEPRFVDLAARNFALHAASPAIDAGKVLEPASVGTAARARSDGDRPDLGAQGPVGAPAADGAAIR